MSRAEKKSTSWKTAGVRWLLPFWLLAAFAGAELAFASEPGTGRAALVESWSSNLPAYKGDPAAEVLERHRPAQPEVAQTAGDSLDDAVARPLPDGEQAPAPRETGRSPAWHVAGQIPAFKSRAPPAQS